MYTKIYGPHAWERSLLAKKNQAISMIFTDAVAVRQPGDYHTTVGHVPRSISAVCYFFLKRGSITCEVLGPRQHSNDLPQGGLEVPCRLTFIGTGDDTSKVEKLLVNDESESLKMLKVTEWRNKNEGNTLQGSS